MRVSCDEDVLQRRDRQPQLGEFALEVVELDDGVAPVGLGEDVLLELVQFVAELGDDRQVVVDDEVEDRVQAVGRAERQQFGFALDPRAHRRVRQRRAVAHGDQVARAEERIRLAEADVAFDHLRRMHDHEQRIAVGLDLRPLVRVLRVLDREVVQAELLLQLVQQRVAGSYMPTQTKLPSSTASTSLIWSRVMSRRSPWRS